MKRNSQVQFGSLMVSPWSPTPYSDAINRGGRTSEETASGRKARIKRPMNGFMVWSQTKRRELSAENPGLHNAEISRRLGQLWLQMTEEDRLPFMEEAERLRILHSRQYPGYRYRPRKKRALTEEMIEAADEMRHEVESLPTNSESWMKKSRQVQDLYERGSSSMAWKCPEEPSKKKDSEKRFERALSFCVETLHRQPWEVQSQLDELDESLKFSDERSQTLDCSDISRPGPSYPTPETQSLQANWDQVLSRGGQPSFEASSAQSGARLGDLPSPIEANTWPNTLWHGHTPTWKGFSDEVNHRPIQPEAKTKNWSAEDGSGATNFDLNPSGPTEYPASSDFAAVGGSSDLLPVHAVSPTSGPGYGQNLQPPLNIPCTPAHRLTHLASKTSDSGSVSSSIGSQDCWELTSGGYSDNWGNAACTSPDFALSPTFDIDPVNLSDDLNDLSDPATSCNYATAMDPFVSWLINFYDVELSNPCSAQ